jgi:signal transduction histidine kinase
VRSRGWSLGARISVLFALFAGLLTLIAGAGAATAAANRGYANEFIGRIGPAASNTERLLGVALEQRVGLRAYAGVGRTEYLQQYQGAVAEERHLIDDTERLLRGEPALLARLSAVRDRLEHWRQIIAEPLIARVRVNGPDPTLATPDAAADAAYEPGVAAIDALNTDMTAKRDELRVALRRTADLLTALLISALLTVVGAGVLAGVLLRRLVTRSVVALASEVRRVADGDYGHPITGGGPPELADLARDVNAMRRKIAADLAEVQRARQTVEEVNAQLEAQAEELTRSNRDLEQFAYVASHDLQEPLRKVASFCQLLQRRYAGQLDERADQYIAFAVDGAQRMQRLINDLLAFSRIGRVTSGFVDVDLNKLVADVVNHHEAGDAEITWDDLPVVRGEEPLLSALLSNLIGNSLKFRRPDTSPRIHISTHRLVDEYEYEFRIRDNGIGIQPEFGDKIFVIFQRLHAKDAYSGTGIGLAIAKKIVEYHGGRIWLDDDHRDGTLIRFTLPVAPGSAGGSDPDVPAAAEEPVS